MKTQQIASLILGMASLAAVSTDAAAWGLGRPGYVGPSYHGPGASVRGFSQSGPFGVNVLPGGPVHGQVYSPRGVVRFTEHLGPGGGAWNVNVHRHFTPDVGIHVGRPWGRMGIPHW